MAGTETYISEAKVILGRDECIAERFSIRSTASCASFKITIVCPKTVTELIGPGVGKRSVYEATAGRIGVD